MNLTPLQLKAYENGATCFFFPLRKNIAESFQYCGLVAKDDITYRACFWSDDLENSLLIDTPFQIGDEFISLNDEAVSFKKCINARCSKVKNIKLGELDKAGGIDIREQLKESNNGKKVKDSDYVFKFEFLR